MTALTDPIRLESSAGRLVAYAHGAHVVSWVPLGASESVLWLSPHAVFDTATAIRGGVPVCFPWFGPGRTGEMSPAHGFARISRWEVLEQRTGTDALHLVVRLDSSMSSDPQFPSAYEARLEVVAAKNLVIRLVVRNTSNATVTYEEALHAYLAVSDVASVRVVGLDGATYADKSLGGAIATQSGDVLLTGETDRAYHSASDITVIDPGAGRSLVVRKAGSASTIVWNPGPMLASRMADVGADSWHGFVCIEAGNVLGDAVTLGPGEEHCLEYRLSVEPHV